MSAGQVFDLAVEAKLESLQKVREYIDASGSTLGVSEVALGDLRLVVDEAVTNVIHYGYRSPGGIVEVHMESAGNDVIIRIRDRAETFDTRHVGAPQLNTALEDRPFGGMGIYLIRKMTDEAEYRTRPGGGNELRLVNRGAIQGGNHHPGPA